MEKDLVSVVFPTMNRKCDLIKCINSVKESTYDKIEIIVADNSSIDGSKEAVKELFPDVILLENELNLGSPISINDCIKKSKGEFIFRLDDDVIIEKNTIENMLKVLKSDPQIGAVSAICFYMENPNLLRAAGLKISLFFGKTIAYGKDETNLKPFKENREIEGAGGGTLMTRRKIFDKIGFYDESYFLTYEDVDWCYKLKKAGYKLVLVGGTKLYHKKEVGGPTNENPLRTYFLSRGQVLFMKKNAGWRNIIFFPYLFLLLYPIKVLLFLKKGYFKSIGKLTRGIWDAIFHEKVFVYNKEGEQIDYET